MGNNKSKAHVQSTFSHKQETVTNLLNELITEIEMSVDSNTTSSNTVGKVNMVATNKSKINVELSQDATVRAAQTYMMLIDKIMDSSANTDVKLDALSSVCQAVKNDGNILSSPETTDANIQLENKTENNLTNIQKLNQDLKFVVATCAVNNFEGGNFLADNEGEINFVLKQKADAISDQLMDMVTNEKSTLDPQTKQEMKSQIDADNKAEGRGVLAGAGQELGKTARSISGDVKDAVNNTTDNVASGFKTIVFAIVAPIIIIILVIAFIIIYSIMKKKNSDERPPRYDDYDDEDEEENEE
jgi:hypothetical protein